MSSHIGLGHREERGQARWSVTELARRARPDSVVCD